MPALCKKKELARQASEIEDIDLYIADSWTEYKNNLWSKIYEKWTDRWQADSRHRLTKIFYPTPSKQKSKKILKLTREKLSLWVQIVTRQNNLNYIQSKIYNIDPICRFCNEEDETFPHLLNECPCFMQARCDILQARATEIQDWTMENILKFAKLNQIKTALSFDQPQFLFPPLH